MSKNLHWETSQKPYKKKEQITLPKTLQVLMLAYAQIDNIERVKEGDRLTGVWEGCGIKGKGGVALVCTCIFPLFTICLKIIGPK